MTALLTLPLVTPKEAQRALAIAQTHITDHFDVFIGGKHQATTTQVVEGLLTDTDCSEYNIALVKHGEIVVRVTLIDGKKEPNYTIDKMEDHTPLALDAIHKLINRKF